jgi:hypothetical protein
MSLHRQDEMDWLANGSRTRNYINDCVVQYCCGIANIADSVQHHVDN